MTQPLPHLPTRSVLALATTLAAATWAGAAHAGAFSVTDPSAGYSQNFDSLPSSGNTTFASGTTLEGWYLRSASPLTGTYTESVLMNLLNTQTAFANVTAIASAGTPPALTATTRVGGFFNFGSAAASDRALGSMGGNLQVGGFAGGNTYGYSYNLALTNNSATTITDVSLRYDGEQWGVGAGSGTRPADRLKLFYALGVEGLSPRSAQWQAAGNDFNFSAPQVTGSARALNGNAAANRVADIGGTISLDWAPGSTLWFRWLDGSSGNTVALSEQSMGIDNVSLAFTAAPPVPEPATYASMAAGLALVAGVAARRRRCA